MNIALSLNSGIRRRMRVGLVALGVSCLTAHLALAQAKAPSTSTEAEPAAEAAEGERPADRQARPWLLEPHKKPLATGESAPFPWKSAVLLVGIASLGALAWRRRNAGRSYVKADRSARLSVLDSVRVGPRAQLVLTRVGDRTLLLGVTEDSVRRIAWIDQPATGSVQAESTRSDGRHFLDVMRAEGARAERAARNSLRPTAGPPPSANATAALPASSAPAASAKSAPEEAAPSTPMAMSSPAATSSAPAETSLSTAAPASASVVAAERTGAPAQRSFNAALEIAASSNDTVEWSRGAAAAPRSRRSRSVSSEKPGKPLPVPLPVPVPVSVAEPMKTTLAEEPRKTSSIEESSAPLGPTTSTISESRALDPSNKPALPGLHDDGLEGQAAGVVQRRGRRRV